MQHAIYTMNSYGKHLYFYNYKDIKEYLSRYFLNFLHRLVINFTRNTKREHSYEIEIKVEYVSTTDREHKLESEKIIIHRKRIYITKNKPSFGKQYLYD